jgi:hypothetical protein
MATYGYDLVPRTGARSDCIEPKALHRQAQYIVDESCGEGSVAHQQPIEHGCIYQIECNLDVEVLADLAARHRGSQKRPPFIAAG